MDLKLLILKRKSKREYISRRFIQPINFAVMDMDKATGYPANFICVLPKQMEATGDYRNIFSSIFRENSLITAEKLLTEALKIENDPEIMDEIEKRLKLIQTKPFNLKR